jgi:hypothetical protein
LRFAPRPAPLPDRTRHRIDRAKATRDKPPGPSQRSARESARTGHNKGFCPWTLINASLMASLKRTGQPRQPPTSDRGHRGCQPVTDESFESSTSTRRTNGIREPSSQIRCADELACVGGEGSPAEREVARSAIESASHKGGLGTQSDARGPERDRAFRHYRRTTDVSGEGVASKRSPSHRRENPGSLRRVSAV